MKNLKFKSASAYNFLPFGPEGIEISFEELGNIILVRGQNMDIDESSLKESSNGSGKSSIPEIIVYALFGKTIKSPKKFSKNDVVNNLIKKNCKVEIIFDKYKVSRGRSPDFLRLWESEDHDWTDKTEITQGKSVDTQLKIEEIIGLSYESFIKTSVFTDDISSYFLEADTPKKREIVENLLSLDVYRQRFDASKNLLRDSKNFLKQYTSEYEILDKNKTSIEQKIEQANQNEISWKNGKKKEISTLIVSIKDKKSKLENLNEEEDLSEYEKARERIDEINIDIENNNSVIKKLADDKLRLKESIDLIKKELESKKDSIRKLDFEIKNKKSSIEKNNKEIKKLHEHEPGQTCGVCYGKIDPENYSKVLKKYNEDNDVLKKEIKDFSEDILSLNPKKLEEDIKEKEKKVLEFSKKEQEINANLNSLRNEFVKLSAIKEPESNSVKKVLQAEIELLTKKAKELKEEFENTSPYSEIIANLIKDKEEAEEAVESKKEKIQEAEKEIPYYSFWVDAFGDKGIRKWVVDGIIPALNSKLMYWMQVLDNNRLKIEFNNELEESIFKIINDEQIDFFYHTMSAGQKRRLNLAVSLSFAHVMLLTTGTCPSIMFLDEVTTNIDPIGVNNIYHMICELAEDRQIFITTHDNDLLSMLSGSDILNLIMENGISKLEKD
jgi:DNA repair exonuclease SbcCD ATPase subunit